MKTIKKILRIIYRTCILLLVMLAIMGALHVSKVVKPPVKVRVVEKEIIKEVEAQEKSIRELIEIIPPQYGINPLIAAAIVERESNGKKDAIRFEPGQLSRAKKITSDPEQQRMYASSHCYFQVMGWWAPEFNLSWADLYDPQTCAEVGMTILSKCMEKHKKKSKYNQVYNALACYNGSTAYADAVMNRLERLLIDKML